MEIRNIDEVLREALEDPAVAIKHGIVIKGQTMGYHVAEIGKQVQAHVHFNGDEFYHVLSGEGEMNIGEVKKGMKVIRTNWEAPVKVKENDVFIVPERYAHSLVNKGKERLVIAFVCPASHLEDMGDRYILNNPPERLTDTRSAKLGLLNVGSIGKKNAW
ncbi:MAG: cupin domain-containing protein [archaeon]